MGDGRIGRSRVSKTSHAATEAVLMIIRMCVTSARTVRTAPAQSIHPQLQMFTSVSICKVQPVLGGSWLVISGVISPLIWAITIITLRINPTYNYP